MRFVKVETQLSVFAENKPGRMAQICALLGEASVNIYSMTVHDTVDHSIVRLIVDNPTKAIILLEEGDFHIVTQKVVVLDIDNKPGTLAAIARRLARADENIEYAYCTASRNQDSGLLVVKTKDAEHTAEVLQEC